MTYQEVAEWYSTKLDAAECQGCKRKQGEVWVGIGPHPEGRKGSPQRRCGSDFTALEAWIEAAGFWCRKCKPPRKGTAASPSNKSVTGQRKTPYPREYFEYIIEYIKSYCTRKGIPEEGEVERARKEGSYCTEEEWDGTWEQWEFLECGKDQVVVRGEKAAEYKGRGWVVKAGIKKIKKNI